MKGASIIAFMIVLSLEGDSVALTMIQLALLLTISMIFIASNKREERMRRLKSDVFYPVAKEVR